MWWEGVGLTEPDYSRDAARYSTSSRRPSHVPRQVGGPSVHRGREVPVSRGVPAQRRGYPSRNAQAAPAAAPRPTAQQLYPGYLKKRRRSRLLKRVGVCVLTVLLVAVCATGGYALWYSAALDGALSMGSEQDANVDSVLVPAEPGKPFYMLLLGSDSREGSGTSNRADESGDAQRSDVMILARVDAANRQVTLVSIPRDTRYVMDDGTLVKINEAYNLGGPAESIKAVTSVTGTPISHYAEVHFSEFQELVDKLDGITVDVPIEISYKDALTGETVTLQPGVQTLDGQQAQIFARVRHEYGDNQEAKRQSNIRQILSAIIEKVLQKPVTELPGTILDLAESVGTDMDTSDIVSLGLTFSGGSGGMTMYSCTGPSNGDFDEANNGLWLCYENPEGWAKLMGVVDSGEDPSGLDVESTAIVPPALDEAA